jgi:putative oxidoreductase
MSSGLDHHIVRVAVAGTLVIHGITRLFLGVPGFGEYLDSQGIPLGGVVAWVLTLVEVAGGLTLAAGFFARPLAVWFALELTAGIAMVHAKEGWFVVGAGRNGVEYSVVLILCLASVFVAGGRRR